MRTWLRCLSKSKKSSIGSWILKFGAFYLLFSTAFCASGPVTIPARPGPNLIWQQYVLDSKFPDREISLLLRADQLLYEQTGGRIVITPAMREVSLSWHLERFLKTDT